MPAPVLILDAAQIQAKIKRMAWQLCELLYGEEDVLLIGVAEAGYVLASALAEQLNAISDLRPDAVPMYIDKRNPAAEICLNIRTDNRAIVLIDDVADSGRTLLYALRPLLSGNPSRIIMAVLVDRKHKRFPISPDVVGHSLSTTIEEHIRVESENNVLKAVFLE